MKKSIYKYLFMMVAVALCWSSCDDDLNKDDIDLDSLIDNSNCPIPHIDEVTSITYQSAVLSGSVAPTQGQDKISEVGFLVSVNSEFYNATSYVVDLKDDNTFAAKAKLVPETKYFVKAFVLAENKAVQFSAVKEFTAAAAPDEQWEVITDKAVFKDGVIPPSFGLTDPTILPNIVVEKLKDREIYRMKDVYGAAYPYNEPGDYSDSPFYIKIDCETYSKPGDAIKTVFIEEQDMGIAWSYGMFKICSIYGNLSQKLENFPLGTFDPSTGIFNFGAVGLYIDGYDWQTCSKTMLYLDPSKMVTDYDNDFTYSVVGSGTFKSTAFGQSWKQTLMVAKEDETVMCLPDLYAEKHPIYLIFNPEDGTATFPHDFNTGVKFMGNDVYVAAQKGSKKPLFDLDKHILSLNVKFYMVDAEGNTIADLLTTSDTLTYIPKKIYSSEDIDKATSIDDYVGSFTMTATDAFEAVDFNRTLTLTKVDETHLSMTGILDMDYCGTNFGYTNDAILLEYKSGLLLFSTQEAGQGTYGTVYADPYSSKEDDIFDESILVAGVTEDGKVAFVNDPTNEKAVDGIIYSMPYSDNKYYNGDVIPFNIVLEKNAAGAPSLRNYYTPGLRSYKSYKSASIRKKAISRSYNMKNFHATPVKKNSKRFVGKRPLKF